MSCSYRSMRYRCAVTCHGHGDSDTANREFGAASHPHPVSVRPPMVGLRPESSEPSVPMRVWQMLNALIHSSSQADRAWAVNGLAHLGSIYGWQAIPKLSDETIMAVWETMLSMIAKVCRSGSPIRFADPIIGQQMGTVVRLCFMHASDAVRGWMWEQVRQIKAIQNLGIVAEVETILGWYVPLWMLPKGIFVLANIVRFQRAYVVYLVMMRLNEALRFWKNTTDPTMIARMRDLVTDVLLPSLPPANDDSLIMWINTLATILSIDPTLCDTVPGLTDVLMTACTAQSPMVVRKALHLLETRPLVLHARFRAILKAVIRRNLDQDIIDHAARLLIQSFVDDPNAVEFQRLLAIAYRRLCTSQQDEARSAAAIFRAAMECPQTAPQVLPYVQSLCTTTSVSPGMLDVLQRVQYAPMLTGEMIRLAECLSASGFSIPAGVLLSRAWRTGNHHRIIPVVERMTDPITQIAVLKAGIWSSDVGKQIVDSIRAIDPFHAAIHVLDGITTYFPPDQPIPYAILPDIVQACLHVPDDMSSTVLDLLWRTDPQTVVSMMNRLSADGRLTESTVAEMVPIIVQRAADAPDSVSAIWDDLVRRSSPTIRLVMATAIDDWVTDGCDGNLPIMLAMHHVLYQTCVSTWKQMQEQHDRQSDDAHIVRDTMDILIRSLGSMWGHGHDPMILSAIDTAMDHTMNVPLDTDIVAQVVYSLLRGWGRGMDHAIDIRLLRLMEWLDHQDPSWTQKDLGSLILLSMITSYPYRPGEIAGIPYRFDSRTVVRLRKYLERSVANRGR